MSSRTCPDWPELTEIAPDLQFKHYTVAEARLPTDALVRLGDFPMAAVAICADLDKNVFYAAAHRSAGGRGAAGHALVRGARVVEHGPGRERVTGALSARRRHRHVRISPIGSLPEGGPRPDPGVGD